MQAIKDLLGSERGLLGLLLIIAVTVLAVLDKVDYASWREYTLYVFGIYVGGKTISSTAAILKGAPATNPPPSNPATPAAA